MKLGKSKLEDNYLATILYSLAVVISWGIVPSLAKLGTLSTGLTTFYVNWFAVAGLGIFMIVTGKIRKIDGQLPFKKLIFLGAIWPLTYSIAYFGAIDLGSASLTTITNYCWPAIFIIVGWFAGKRFSPKKIAVITIAILAVIIPIALEEKFQILLVPILLGLIAAFCQALYSLLTENLNTEPLVVTLVVELVTAIGATVYVGTFEKFTIPPIQIIAYLAIIGIVSNGFGFWAFLKAGQVSHTEQTKTLFLVLMCLTPITQVVLLPLLHVESVSVARWVGVALIALAFLFYLLSSNEKT